MSGLSQEVLLAVGSSAISSVCRLFVRQWRRSISLFPLFFQYCPVPSRGSGDGNVRRGGLSVVILAFIRCVGVSAVPSGFLFCFPSGSLSGLRWVPSSIFSGLSGLLFSSHSQWCLGGPGDDGFHLLQPFQAGLQAVPASRFLPELFPSGRVGPCH